MHPVFPVSLLEPAADNPLPGQKKPPPPPVEIDGEPEYEVEEIVDSQIIKGKLNYRAKWRGHDPDPTWYLAENFNNSQDLVEDFHRRYPKKPCPSSIKKAITTSTASEASSKTKKKNKALPRTATDLSRTTRRSPRQQNLVGTSVLERGVVSRTSPNMAPPTTQNGQPRLGELVTLTHVNRLQDLITSRWKRVGNQAHLTRKTPNPSSSRQLPSPTPRRLYSQVHSSSQSQPYQ